MTLDSPSVDAQPRKRALANIDAQPRKRALRARKRESSEDTSPAAPSICRYGCNLFPRRVIDSFLEDYVFDIAVSKLTDELCGQIIDENMFEYKNYLLDLSVSDIDNIDDVDRLCLIASLYNLVDL